MTILITIILFGIFAYSLYQVENKIQELKAKLRKTEKQLDRVSYMLEQATDYKDEWEYDIFKGKKN